MTQKKEIGELLLHGAGIWGSNGKYTRLFEDGTLCEITLLNDRYRIAFSKDKRKSTIEQEYHFDDAAMNVSRILFHALLFYAEEWIEGNAKDDNSDIKRFERFSIMDQKGSNSDDSDFKKYDF